MKIHENKVFQIQAKGQLEMYRSISENFDNQKRKTHEYKNQIACIESLLDKKQYSKLEEYVKKIYGSLNNEPDANNTNLLNNAIEACETCEGKKVIKFKFVKEDDMTIIAGKNTFNYEVKYENGEIKSTKTANVDEHGVGIKNVLKSIEKYGGSYIIEDKNKEFFFSIIIPA